MQIDFNKLIPSPESSLVISIIIYLAIAIGVGAYRSRKYLFGGHPNEKKGREYHHQNETVALTFAGFSLTSLALLVSIRYNELSAISNILLFFSLSLLFLILSSVTLRFRIVNFFVYVSDVFLNVGLLSIACGFLVFFGENVSWIDGSTIVFCILFVALFVASLANYILFDKYSQKLVPEVKK